MFIPRYLTSADGTTIAFDRSGSGPALVLVGGAFQHLRASHTRWRPTFSRRRSPSSSPAPTEPSPRSARGSERRIGGTCDRRGRNDREEADDENNAGTRRIRSGTNPWTT